MSKLHSYFTLKMILTIKRIKALETYPIRHSELRKGRPIESCAFEGDHLQSTLHLGAYFKDTLIGIASFMQQASPVILGENDRQLRGMAILTPYQQKGYGAALLEKGVQILKNKGCPLVWMNAREKAVTFYEKLGYTAFGNAFNIPEIGIHYVLYKKIKS